MGVLGGKVAIVTGAGGGIGREIAIAMARAGARVVVNDSGASLAGDGGSATPAEETARIIGRFGGYAAVSTDSVAEWPGAQQIVQCALDSFGRIDAVVNNAGILRDAIFHKLTPQDWLAVIGVHLNGSFFVSRAAVRHFRAQRSGAFVHMTSTSGLVGNFGQANYAAAKLGIVGLSHSIALDMARFHVRSNCIAPFAWSRMTAAIPAATAAEQRQVAGLRADGAGEERAAGGVPGLRRGGGGERPGVRDAHERDLPVRPHPAHPQRASRRGLDAGTDRGARAAGAQFLVHPAGALARRVLVGPDLISAQPRIPCPSQPPPRRCRATPPA